jgi:membrane dipeptidase
MMKTALFLHCSVSLILGTMGAAESVAAQAQDSALRHAMEVLRTSPIIDTHNDLPWVIREKGTPPRDVESYPLLTGARFDTDIPRLRKGMIGAQFWSVYVPSDLSSIDMVRDQLEQIDIARRMIAKFPNDLAFAGSAADIRREMAEGRIASLLGIEGGHTIANSLGALRDYYGLGVRYMTLTHFNNNDWADAATDSVRHHGLTPFGREVVREMNRLGMLVDLSHVSDATMSDALATTEAPVIFSHSSARGLTNHVRNVPDSILKLVARNGGVVMVAFIPPFVSEKARQWDDGLLPRLMKVTADSQWQRITREYVAEKGPAPRATVKDVADHVEYIRRVAGIDHVGIGADFYGAESPNELVSGLEDVSKYPALFAELVRRGWSDADLRKLANENLLRVFTQAEVVAQRLAKSRPPSNATIEEMDRRPTSQ